MVSKEQIERIKNSVDIVQVISQYVSLQKVGSNYRGLCPFHSEKTPSFHVNPTLKLYHCFGCGASGDVIKFIQEIEHISFQEALQKLGRQAGIEVKFSSSQSGKDEYVEYLFRVHTEYRNCLRKNSEVVQYLFDRGLNDREIEEYEFGYCPGGSKIAYEVASKLSLQFSKAIRYGLMRKVESGYVDTFENRIIIPIKDDFGRIVAFGGRTVSNREPKYLNSPETPYFSKRSVLFMFDKAKKAIKGVDFVVVTEGYFDAIAFHRIGVTNAVATLGTSLSEIHLMKLKPLTKNIILCFDSDDAGKRATMSTLKIFLENDFDVAIAQFKEKDPDEVLRKSGADMLKDTLKKALPFEEYIVEFYSKQFELSTTSGTERFLMQLRPWTRLMLSLKKIERYENLLRIISSKTRLSTAQLSEYFKSKAIQRTKFVKTNLPSDEDYLIYLYITREDLRREISKIDRSLIREQTAEILDLLENNLDLSEFDEETRKYIFDVMSKIPPGDSLKIFEDIKKNFIRKSIEKRLSQIDSKLAICKDERERANLLRERLRLISSLNGTGGGQSGA